MTYIIKLMADRTKAGLGRFSLYLIYTYFLHKAFLILTHVILNYYN